MKLTNIIQYSLYNFVKRRPQNIGTYLNLYQSRVFPGNANQSIRECLPTQQAQQRYKQYIQIALMSQSGLAWSKALVTNWQFNPESETFKITTLRTRGLLTQEFRSDNIIPWTYADMIACTKIPEPVFPVYLDDVMVYLNKFNNDIYLFESDGTWNQQTVEHPKLSLENTLDQKQWFDRRLVQ